MTSKDLLAKPISRYGAILKEKLSRGAIKGAPEDQLRAPLEGLIQALAELAGFSGNQITAIGETSIADLKIRPDYAITIQNALTGFIEVKAPGKGADPRKFQEKHDKEQWEKLKSLPNLVYTDGNSFSLWRNGELIGEVARLNGDVETSGAALTAPPQLLRLFSDFFRWQPTPPRNARQLADTSARLCRLLRDEVAEQLSKNCAALVALAADWRKLLFPNATNAEFADGYAQAVTFGLLMARARGIGLSDGLERAANLLKRSNSLIGTALGLLTDEAASQSTLKVSLSTLTRVLDVVDWTLISKGDPEAWLYFYEHFLSAYDNKLRKKTGSYYTPPQIVTAMVRLVDEVLRDPRRFALSDGLASPDVTLADPAVGSGTFLLGVLRRIAETTTLDQGAGAVPAVVQASVKRLIGFEVQFGPFSVAQLRLLAEIADLMHESMDGGKMPLRLYVTDTLCNPDEENEWIPGILKPLADSRREANAIKRQEPITVVIGNPPYKEKAKGLGGWVENGSANAEAPLKSWMPPVDWGVSAHTKHLRNLYVYFWRWASWKVFGGGVRGSKKTTGNNQGVICFITVAGFLNGPGFQKMRAELRREADEIWVIDCSPEGHQPEVPTRVFQGVQQPVCIVLASRTSRADPDKPARVRFRALPAGRREEKFEAITRLTLDEGDWVACQNEWRASFLPAAAGAWATYPALDDLFIYNGSGVMAGRTWVIAPDTETLRARWAALVQERNLERKELLFHPHIRNGSVGDKSLNKSVKEGLAGHEYRGRAVGKDSGEVITPVRYGFRSFDRQWLIPDSRVLNQPNPALWAAHSITQVYITAPFDRSPTNGPSVTATSMVPDLHHYNGRGGRVFPLWSDSSASVSNVKPKLLSQLAERYGIRVSGPEFMAYIAAIATHPAFVRRFAADLVQPGLRIPITADVDLFRRAVGIGLEVIWLHSFGERFISSEQGRPAGPPRLSRSEAPVIPAAGGIPSSSDEMPNEISYDAELRRLRVGAGYVDNVPAEVWEYEVSGKQVLSQWFSYRRRDRSRPMIGDRRPPSPLGDIQPNSWLAEYTTELLNVLHVLGRLVRLEPAQNDLLGRICDGEMIGADLLAAAGAFDKPSGLAFGKSSKARDQMTLLD